ncbi:MAG TPA: hexose kinase [Salinimicrobium sp.]|nr:hexose kinase [Salinimicrobium sp.]
MILSVCPNPSIDTYAWLDTFRSGKVNRIEKVQEFPGGKGIHVALALAELGMDSKLFGLWAGAAGEWIKAACEEKRVSVSGVQVKGNNRKCYTFRSADPNFNHSELLEPGPEINAGDWTGIKENFQKEIENASLICMSGSWPKGVPHDAYRQIIEIANEQNKRVILDCSGSQLKEALKTDIFGLHLNEHEAKNLCGSSDLEVLIEFLKGKVALVALTKGKEGLELYYKNEVFKANVKLENIISTIGSGDCLTAGIAYAVNKDMKPGEIAKYGVACGAANCLIEALGMLKKETVEKLLPKVGVDMRFET